MKRPYAVVQAHGGDYTGTFSVIDTHDSEQKALARREEIIRLRAAPTSPWPTQKRVTAQEVQGWKRVR